MASGNSNFAEICLERILADPHHPLDFLVDRATGKWLGRSHLDDGPGVQMGHLTSKHGGGPERLAIEDAEYNQKASWRGESQGAIFEKTAVDIGGVPVMLETARLYERLGLLPIGTAALALASPGWSPLFGIAPAPTAPLGSGAGTPALGGGAAPTGTGVAAGGTSLLGGVGTVLTGLGAIVGTLFGHSADAKEHPSESRDADANGPPVTSDNSDSTNHDSGDDVRQTPANANASDEYGAPVYEPATHDSADSVDAHAGYAGDDTGQSFDTSGFSFDGSDFISLPAIDAAEAMSFTPIDMALPAPDLSSISGIDDAGMSYFADNGVQSITDSQPDSFGSAVMQGFDDFTSHAAHTTDLGIVHDTGMSIGPDHAIANYDSSDAAFMSIDHGHGHEGAFGSFDPGYVDDGGMSGAPIWSGGE